VKVGDLVRWHAHALWQRAGLGTVVERKYDRTMGWKYKIMWHIDIEDIVNYKGVWYYDNDFEDGTIVKV
jgi:hypothetical protein